MKYNFLNFAGLARFFILSKQGTSVPCKRLLSTAGTIVNKLRSWLLFFVVVFWQNCNESAGLMTGTWGMEPPPPTTNLYQLKFLTKNWFCNFRLTVKKRECMQFVCISRFYWYKNDVPNDKTDALLRMFSPLIIKHGNIRHKKSLEEKFIMLSKHSFK